MLKLILIFVSFNLASPKNVLLMIADDAGLETPVYGNTHIKTPNIDGLAERSLLFDSAYTVVSSCSPSRSSILTGLPPHQNGMYGLKQGYHHFQCFDQVMSLPKLLKKQRIRTGIIGKKHVGPKSVFPFDFEETEENNSILQVGRNITKIKGLVTHFLARYKATPFLLYVAFHDPHRCGHTHPQYGEFCEKFGNGEERMGIISDWKPARYEPDIVEVPYFIQNSTTARKDIAAQYTTISRLDQGIGLVVEEFNKLGLLNDTLIIYSSDNGIPFPSGRTNLYNPGVVEPLMVSSPLHQASHGQRTSEMVSLLDITPTILDWFNVSYPSYHINNKRKKVKLTGRSLIPLLRKVNLGENKRKVYFSHSLHEVTMYYPMRGLRTQKYKLIHNINYKMPFPIDQDFYMSPTFQEILQKYRNNESLDWYKSLTNYYYRPEWELFDMRHDSQERINQINSPSYSSVARKLRKALFRWQNDTSDPWLCSPHGVLQDSGAYKENQQCFPLFNDVGVK